MTLLPGWKYYRDITVDHTNVDADLTAYPIYLNLSAAGGIGDVDLTSLFTEIGANNLKLAVADDSGNEGYVEEVSWSAVTPAAELWTAFSISSAANTTLRIYYDATHADNSTYIGVTGSAPAEAVWDANYVAVYHMNDNPDTSHIMDSTTNDYDGTKLSANNPLEADGDLGKKQTFSSDYIEMPAAASVANLSTFSIEVFARPNPLSANNYIYGESNTGLANPIYGFTMGYVTTGICYFQHRDDAGSFMNWSIATAYIADSLHYAVQERLSASTWEMYSDGLSVDTNTDAQGAVTINRVRLGAINTTYYGGSVSEFRSSNIARSAAHVKANYYNWTDALVTFGAEQKNNTIRYKPFIPGLAYNSQIVYM